MLKAYKEGFSPMRTRLLGWLAAGAMLAGAGTASAHHSFAMFDLSVSKTLVGTVKEFQWTNPHTWIWIDVPAANSATETWGIEGMSPNFLARRGWSKATLKAGDKVTVVIHPVKTGEHGGSFMKVTLPSGQVMDMMGASPAAK